MSHFAGRGSDYSMAGFSVFLVVMDPTAFLAKTSLPASDFLVILNLNPNQFPLIGSTITIPLLECSALATAS